MKRKILYAALGLLCLFIITNPSATSFKEHLGKTTYAGLIRQHNFFVYSTYLDNSYDEPKDKVNEGTYVGVLGNFWRVEKSVPKDAKLYAFYEAIKSNPNIKGIPADYAVFKRVMTDKNKSKQFFEAIKKNDSITGLPSSYDEFSNKLGLDN